MDVYITNYGYAMEKMDGSQFNMKYKYELISACGSWDYCIKLKKYLLSIKNSSIKVTEELNKWNSKSLYITFNNFEDLEHLALNIPEEVYDDINDYSPHEFLIDFKNKDIYFGDFYLE